jgi:beta-lactamase class A
MKSNRRTTRAEYVTRTSAASRYPKSKKRGGWLILTAAALFLAAVIIAVYSGLVNADFKIRDDVLKLELGSELVFEPAEWIEASPEILSQIEVDTSEIDIMTEGQYFINIAYRQKKDKIKVVVEDTIKPSGIPVKDKIIVQDKVIRASDLIGDITDFSDVIVSFDRSGRQFEQQFSQPGAAAAELFLTDAAGNQNSYVINLMVVSPDTKPPVLSGIDETEIRLGDRFDPLGGITAEDETDGDLTDRIKYSGRFDTTAEGIYQIDYTVTDSSGNTAEFKSILRVSDPFAELKAANSIVAEVGSDSYGTLNEVLEYLGEKTGNVGIFYEDLSSGDSFSINADRQFRSASTAKLFVNMALYDLVERGKADLSEKIYYTEADYEGGTGILQNMDLTVGYSLGTLADYAMLHSDNIAFKMIRRYVGRQETFDYYESIIGHPTDRDMTSMSAADGADLIRHLYEAGYKTFDHMLDTMRRTDFNDMLPKYLPENIVAHKIGFYSSYYHDVGIVYDGDKPYIIAIYSDNLPEPQETIAQISRIIYESRNIS